jgi:DNA-directed RNA polymerase subunit RPC12/RpoP
METRNVQKLSHNIVSCHDLTSNEIHTKDDVVIEIKKILSNGFNEPIWRLCCNERIYTKNSKVNVTYKCIECDRVNTVTLLLFLRKIHRNITKCNTCKNLVESKRQKHSEWMKGDKVPKVKTVRKACPKDLIAESLAEFEAMDDDFKGDYFRKYMTHDEYIRIKSKICSFQHKKFVNMDEFQYLPILKVNNQFRFYPSMYHKGRDCFEKLSYITFKCDSCGNEFENKTLEVQKNKYKIFCQECNFTNNTFKIRTHKNCVGDTILYQSQFEKKFIDFCNTHHIIIHNGPKIEYVWNGKTHTYRSDFYIPHLHWIIELKDHHIWHKKQVESGKWLAKENAARNLVEKHTDQFKAFVLVYPTNYMQFLKSLTTKI